VTHRVDLRQGETLRIQVHPDDDANATVTGVQVMRRSRGCERKRGGKGKAIKTG